MAKIINFTGITFGRIEPDKILEAGKGQYKEVLLIGLDQDDNDLIAASTGDLPTILWMLERAKKFILEQNDE